MFRLLLVSLFVVASAAAQSPQDRARSLYAAGDAPAALAVLVDEPPTDAEGTRLAARIALDLGRPLDAARWLADADSADAAAQLLLGRSYEALGDRQRAEAAYARSVRADSAAAALPSLAALVLQRSPRAAIPLYRRLASRDSLNPAPLGALGRALAGADSVAAAVPVLRRAFALYPRDEATALALARALDGDSTLTAHLDAALAALPRSAELWRLRGADAMRRGATPLAVQAYRTVLTVADTTAARLRDYGVALFYSGDTAASLEVMAASLARDSTDATALRVAGFAAHAEGQTGRALDLLTRAADAIGREALADLAEQTARVYSEALRDDEALRQIALAEALAPDRATIALNRGVLLQQAGRLSLALAAYREFVERAGPEDEAYLPLAQERIEILETIEQNRVEEDLRRRLNE